MLVPDFWAEAHLQHRTFSGKQVTIRRFGWPEPMAGLRALLAVVAVLSMAPAIAGASDGLTPAGMWRGQAKFTSSVLGSDDPEVATTAELALSVTVFGEVQGAFSGGDCRVTGKAQPTAPGASTALVTLTVSGCSIQSYDGRYEGRLTPAKDGSAQFDINGMIFDRALSNAARKNAITATLNR